MPGTRVKVPAFARMTEKDFLLWTLSRRTLDVADDFIGEHAEPFVDELLPAVKVVGAKVDVGDVHFIWDRN